MSETGNSLQGKAAPTIIDVARRAGVSLKSVSRVINNEAHVSPRLRSKVEAAIFELSYVPDPAARALAGTRSFTIGVLFDNPSPNYTMKALLGAHRSCQTHGYHLRFDTLDSAGDSASLMSQLEAVVRNGRTDGFVLTPPLTDNREVLDFFEQRNIKYVRIAPIADLGRSSSVYIDDAAAAAQVAEYFSKLGHQTFGLINGPAEHGAATTRRLGFIEKLRSLCTNVVIHEESGDFLFESGITAGEALMSYDPRPTAIFATNDDMAAGLLVACVRAGLRVPDDVSIVGFDDSWIANSVLPSLTTVHQPIAEMAAEAVNLLLEIGLQGAPVEERLLNFRFVMRESCGAPTVAK